MDESAPAPRLIATASPKGGAGKTMTTILLACEFAAAGHRVLILDTDIQGSAAGWFNASKAARFPLKNIAVEQITAQDAIMARLQAADSDLIRPPIPTRSRPGFRFDVGHRSDLKPATIPR